ncbi:aconitate hydratase [Anaeromyxobacter oryzae]|uniref:Aconitate hydratase A n=1 Tax=Anaeromyxobacter oryzae TaxID=2918170 RepID=A0ABN6MS71_9BACT|nr:aconitate hydratase [Anaeromyxobacter oryzae]BDG02579.1 aconitate hydratase [Anaeromyxobacter oryzae]
MNDPLGVVTPFEPAPGKPGTLVSLPALEKKGFGPVSRLPVSLRIVLESVTRNVDGKRVTEDDVRALAGWQPRGDRSREVPFVLARVLLQDFTGVPLLVDLAAMRAAVARLRKDPLAVEPVVPVDLVIDHSVQVDAFGSPDALRYNMDREMDRNLPRYEFLKWGTQAFQALRIVPPGVGICHQVNLEYLARGVLEKDGLSYPDSLVGTDSHTTMIAGLGVLGWGVGGIEAEAAMLGQPYYFAMPDVVGFHLVGALREGVTATDLVLRITEILRKTKVVGKFVEFFGEGAERLPVPERATISNMSPEFGATVGYFPFDAQSIRYLTQTGRPAALVAATEAYHRAQGLFGMPRPGQVDYTDVVELDLATVRPSVAGPKRPQDRIDLPALKEAFRDVFTRADATGYGKPLAELGQRWLFQDGDGKPVPGGGLQEPETAPDGERKNTSTLTEFEMMNNRPTPDPVRTAPRRLEDRDVEVGHGDVLIAAITSCTNTSNPSVMLAAGLLARKAVAKGLKIRPTVKTSLAPGSRVVTTYFQRTGLQKDLDALGFETVGYGCTTCIGNSGPLDARIEEVLNDHDVVAASVLSGNRNFEARVHQSVRANFLMSPPLVVAFAIAGRVDVDLDHEPLGKGADGKDVYLREIWPTLEEVEALREAAADPEEYRRNYADLAKDPRWNALPIRGGKVYDWNPESTYIQEPPYFTPFALGPGEPRDVTGARALAVFGDSVTTDHISPAGAIKPSSPAGLYLQSLGVGVGDFNTYGARRGNHHVMVRGTFANVRIKNLMVPGVEGGVTIHQPTGRRLPIHDAALEYARDGVPLCVIAGQEYGTGSSRDWAAKGPALLGIRFVVARSFERIHRSNLVGMGVLPCQLPEGVSAQTLGLDGSETYDLVGVSGALRPRQGARLVVHRKDGRREEVPLTVRIDTPIEVEYYRHGGIMPYVLRQIVSRA